MTTSLLGTYLFLFITLLAKLTEQNIVPLEAAFQGRCENGNPCAQNCYNIHNEMYECECHHGFVLSDNGYSCIALNETQKQYTNSNHHNNHLLNPSSDNNNSKKAAKLTSSSKKLSSQHPINIHIEVDIDPPANEQPQLSPEELQSLGLPTNHVHFDVNNSNNNNKQLTSEGEHHEELLAPSDIRVTYTEEDEEEKEEEEPLRDKLLTSLSSEAKMEANAAPYQNYARYTNDLYGTPEPPRALPLYNHHNGDLSDRFPASSEILLNSNPAALEPETETDDNGFLIFDSTKPKSQVAADGSSSSAMSEAAIVAMSSPENSLYSGVEAQCDLQCGLGTCLLEKIDQDKLKKRCLCPLGTSGENCALEHLMKTGAAQFTGHSWISLPTLTHAYSDLQLSLEFKPESPDGVLLLTGETGDMTGDYLALLLRDGHVELRLDCGTGPGIVTTGSKVHLGHWNRLTVFRHDWGVWLQLNGGKHEEGRSQGLFSRITFAQPVLLGGPGFFLNTQHFLASNQSYRGCIRHLEINNKLYHLNPSHQQQRVGIVGSSKTYGDALDGYDIDDCRVDDDDCQTLHCQHHGICTVPFEDNNNNNDGVSSAYCQCPLGFDGQFCETPVEVQIPSFNGKSSHLIFSGLGEKSPLWNDFDLVIRPTSPNGLILYNGDQNNPNGDFVAIFLSNGFIEFAFDAGDGATIVRSHTPLKLKRWHRVRISRTGLLAEVQVDDKKKVAQLATGAFTQVILRQSLYLGGVPTFEMVSPFITVRESFSGCIQKLMINNQHVDLIHGSQGGINVSPCWDHPCSVQNATVTSPCGISGSCKPIMNDYSCECPLGLTGDLCQYSLNYTFETQLVQDMAAVKPTAILSATSAASLLDNAPAFTGDSYLHYMDEPIAQNIIGNTNTFNLRVKVESPTGLLLWTGGDEMSPASDFLLLGLENGFLHFRFNLGNGEGGVIYNQSKIDDGKWHRIRASRIEQTATLRVDNGPIVTGASPGKLRQLNGNGHVFIGGVEDLEQLPAPQFRYGLIGCISELSIGKLFAIDLLNRAKNGQNVDKCRETFDF